MTSTDPDDLLRQLDPGLADLKAKAELAQEQIGASTVTVRSPDGAVSVTVGPGGNLTGLALTDRAYQQPPPRLAAQIMALTGQAQQQVSAQVLAAFGGLVGPNSAAMEMLTQFLPADPAESVEQSAAPPPPPPPAAPPQQPQRRPRRQPDQAASRPDRDDDIDYNDIDFFEQKETP